MPHRPKFTEDESYLVQYVLDGKGAGQSSYFGISYLVVGLAVAVWGLVSPATWLVVVGLCVLAVGRIQELSSDQKWAGVLSSIVGKYEAACAKDDEEED